MSEPRFFVLTRRLLHPAPPWRCVLATADFALADRVSDGLRRPIPRVQPRETSLVHTSALTQAERDRYTAEAKEAAR